MTQKAISLKVDNDILAKLDTYCNESGKKRNRIINEAITAYLDNETKG